MLLQCCLSGYELYSRWVPLKFGYGKSLITAHALLP